MELPHFVAPDMDLQVQVHGMLSLKTLKQITIKTLKQ